MTTDIPEPTIEQLEIMNRQHRKDLNLLKHMSEAQFNVFKKNISICAYNDMNKAETYEILMSMLALNQHLLSVAKAKQKDKN